MNNIPNSGIIEKKNKFLLRYNPNRDRDVALSRAWGAAVKHNRLYSDSCPFDSSGRKEIFLAWAAEVKKIVNRIMTSSEYETAFLKLKDEINREFGRYLSADGFRVSHAQKGLSVYMKHLWCMDIIAEPPQCPVDRVVLTKVAEDKKYKDFGKISWTKINDIDTHRSIISVLQKIADQKSIAIWELENFLPDDRAYDIG